MHPLVRKTLRKLMSPFQKTPFEGAQTQIRVAVDPDLEDVTGKYFSECVEDEMSEAAKNEEIAKWLWDKSVELTKLNKTY